MDVQPVLTSADAVAAAAAAKSNRQIRCGTCRSCTASDCGECANCMDMPKFGGPGHKKQACSRRKCLQLTPCKVRKLDSTQSAAKKPKASASAAAKHGALHVRGHGHERLSITQPQPMSNSELADLMLIAEGGADTYGTPRGGADGETATTFAFAPIQLMPEHFGVMGVAEGDQEHMQAAASNDVYGGLCHAMSQGYTSPSASAHAHPSDRDSAGATGSAARSGATGGEEGGGGSHAANSSVDVFASIVGSELEEARLAANLGMMYGSSAPSASSSPPRASGCGLDASQPCALTQADVAATVLHDSKLEWSWLSLANLEEEFVSMRDILQDERPEQQADLLPSAC